MSEELDQLEVDETVEEQDTPTPEETGEGEPEPENQPDTSVSDELVAKWERAIETMQQAANRALNNPTEQNVKAAEKAKSKVEKLIENEDLDLDPAKAIRDIASETLDYQKKSGETQKQYELRLEAYGKQIAALSEQLYRSQFATMYPDLAGRYDELKQQAFNDATVKQAYELAKNGDANAQQLFQILWQEKWNQVVQKASATKAKPEGKVEKSAKGTSPLKSRAGQAQEVIPAKTAAEILYGPKD